MTKRPRLQILVGIWFALAMFAGQTALAQEKYPAKTITLIVPFAAGGTTDVIGRVIAEGLHAVLRQPVVVENRAGAGGSLGTLAIAKAEPDGYTIGVGTASTLAINPATYKNLQFDVLSDLVPIGNIAAVPNIDLPPLKWSSLKYYFRMEDEIDGEEEAYG